VRPLRDGTGAVEAASVVMLRFQWDSLHRRDRILARDVGAVDLALRPAIVEPTEPSDARAIHPGLLTGEADRRRDEVAAA